MAPGTPLPPEGRLIRFPGSARLRGAMTVRDIVACSAIDRVAGVGAEVTDDSVIDTRAWIRPAIVAGEIVLYVTPLADGRFQPFEIEHPHRCCEVDGETGAI